MKSKNEDKEDKVWRRKKNKHMDGKNEERRKIKERNKKLNLRNITTIFLQ